MEKETAKKLMKKMKKLKTWTEAIYVNPVSYRVNNKLYYAGGFRKENETVATAYMTLDGEEVKAEAYEAQPHLSTFGDISNNIHAGGDDRSKVDTTYFTVPLAVSLKTDQEEVKKGFEAYNKLWDLHQRYVQVYLEFKDYYENDVLVREEITISDVRKTQKTAAWINMYQYGTLKILVEKNNQIKAYVAYLESTDAWDKMTKDQRTFIKGVTETKEKLQENLEDLGLIEDEDEEKMLQLNYEYAIKLNEEQMIGQQQYIRYPK
ncbi:hypothetical protein JTF06_11310 [Desemzia sp. RIT804]|uniref:hypothetical protein n=1 Tax=Desemzia sp. RIT 804 TaxID=2810209 RepID=UPI001950D0A6|nr:hypothetical protein [Desemzia sp. RIT 804]MBM6615479.1 hypothetical protein [Desemzia sp. RIT 804]